MDEILLTNSDSETESATESVVEKSPTKPKRKSPKRTSPGTSKENTEGNKKTVLNISNNNIYIEVSRHCGYFLGSRQRVVVDADHIEHPKFKAYASELRILD